MCSCVCGSGPQGLYKDGDQKTMKTEVVEYARKNWPMFFSRFFEVVKVSGRTSSYQSILLTNKVIINESFGSFTLILTYCKSLWIKASAKHSECKWLL